MVLRVLGNQRLNLNNMEITFNKEKYRKLIDKKITHLLSSTLINISPLNCSDEQIKDFIENRPVVEDRFVLKQLLERTRLFTIPTFFFFKSQRLGDPAISEEVATYFEQYFNHNYREEFQSILDKIESVMNNKYITCPDKYWV